MEGTILSEREKTVLDAIVRNYVLTASPTGSRFVSKHEGIGLSAATIRNVMGDLEDKGFITHPHTSAGRIPTDMGYRYYVDELMHHGMLPRGLKQQIRATLAHADPTDLRVLMQVTSQALSRATDQLGVILAPRLSCAVFRHVHIYETAPRRYLVTITIGTGFVKGLTVEVRTEVSAQRLERACRTINERCYGMTLEEMCGVGDEPFRDVSGYELGVLKIFIPSIMKIMEEDASNRLFAEGTTNILLKPEFCQQIGMVVEILNERGMLMHLFEKTGGEADGVRISIGGEILGGKFESFSVVKTDYQVGNLHGTLGVIGPKRMQYPLLVAAVDYTARTLDELHSGNTQPNG